MKVEERHGFLGRPCHRLSVKDRKETKGALHRFPTEINVRTYRQIIRKGQVLVNCLDALLPGLLGR
ncbi:hypothetical protein D3C86_2005750 [compost metagenome]